MIKIGAAGGEVTRRMGYPRATISKLFQFVEWEYEDEEPYRRTNKLSSRKSKT